MKRKVAVIGINHKGINILMNKLRRSMKDPDLIFSNCSSGWDLYTWILKLKADKIIIIDQFEGDEDEDSKISYITINDRILIIGINPIFFVERTMPRDLKIEWEQIIFQIKRLILKEITLDPIAQF
ncbi:hypothetical protein BBF96_09400 [Anoxybacter fermentans]|uniref:Response regulatory domain-containing protein n=1 Tax=Anoxybacter fermentans TaxID=1323375 RepID=A0A3Q9HSN0_9FIRM|nr:hypothetical protein [Anoxybacter fermentans]AZR73585.1 hypothetical protein BBF96_09400 [Anoxybacter fermentans]